MIDYASECLSEFRSAGVESKVVGEGILGEGFHGGLGVAGLSVVDGDADGCVGALRKNFGKR